MEKYLQTFKNLLLQKKKSYDLNTWQAASETRALQGYINNDPGLTLAYFTARPLRLNGENCYKGICRDNLQQRTT